MIVSERMNLTYKLQLGDTKFKQSTIFKYMVSVLTEDGLCDTEIRRRLRITKLAFPKLSTVLRNSRIVRNQC